MDIEFDKCIFWEDILLSTVVAYCVVLGDLRLKISFDNNKLGLHFIFHGSASLSLIYRQRCSAQKHGTLDHNTSMPLAQCSIVMDRVPETWVSGFGSTVEKRVKT